MKIYQFRIRFAKGGICKKNIEAENLDDAYHKVLTWLSTTKVGEKTRYWAGESNKVEIVKISGGV